MPTVDLKPLIAALNANSVALNTKLDELITAVEVGGTAVGIKPLLTEVIRIADATEKANTQAASVIGTYSDGARVKIFDETPL